jgi:hypothetical protein
MQRPSNRRLKIMGAGLRLPACVFPGGKISLARQFPLHRAPYQSPGAASRWSTDVFRRRRLARAIKMSYGMA